MPKNHVLVSMNSIKALQYTHAHTAITLLVISVYRHHHCRDHHKTTTTINQVPCNARKNTHKKLQRGIRNNTTWLKKANICTTKHLVALDEILSYTYSPTPTHTPSYTVSRPVRTGRRTNTCPNPTPSGPGLSPTPATIATVSPPTLPCASRLSTRGSVGRE